MLGALLSPVCSSPLFGSVGTYLLWGAGSLLAIVSVVAIVIWRGRKRWPVLAAIAKHPFSKYVVASVVAHLVLVIWLLNSSLFTPPAEPGPPPIMVSFDDGTGGSPEASTDLQPSVPAVDPPKQKLTTQPTIDTVERPIASPSPNVTVPKEVPVSAFADASPLDSTDTSLTNSNFSFAPSLSSPDPTPAPLDPTPDTEAPATGNEFAQPESFVRPRFSPENRPEVTPNSQSTTPEPDTRSVADSPPVAQPNVEQAMEAPELTSVHQQDSPVSNQDETLSATESPTGLEPQFRQPVASSFSQIDNQQLQDSDEEPTRQLRHSFSQPEPDIVSKNPDSKDPDTAMETRPKFYANAESVKHVTLQNIRATPPPTTVSRSNPLRNGVSESPTPREVANRNSVVSASQSHTKLIASTKPAVPSGVPPLYHDRLAANRLAIAQQRGGSLNTERAVQAALRWLANAQAPDGRWDASQFGSGRPTFEGGHDRRGAGRNADAGVTGLAVLAFLGAGETHLTGEYSPNVRRALDYLLSIQRRDGSLSGNAQVYAAMYCHGIATLAISEAYSLSRDAELLPAVQSAIRYTLSMQHPVTGGWRYRPGEEGDTSQLGWQMMALTSAHYAGLKIPTDAWVRTDRFLNSVTSRDGRASYRPRQLPSPAMTAEAMLCRLFLRVPPSDLAIQSSARYLLTKLPGQGRTNYYYWYYATLALYHLQDDHWQHWNTAVKRTLVGRQRGDGSWSADSVWGTSGGKVYSTALGALTLEVYYRYRPLVNSTPATKKTTDTTTVNQITPREERGAEHTAWKNN